MDEISPAGRTAVWEVRDDEVTAWVIDPEDYGLEWSGLADLAGGEPGENAERVERVLSGAVTGRQTGPSEEGCRRAVVLNAAAAVYVAGLAPDYRAAIRLAEDALAAGGARQVLARLRVR
jgi:anthranilate phosphoribosyltransferase